MNFIYAIYHLSTKLTGKQFHWGKNFLNDLQKFHLLTNMIQHEEYAI